MAAVTLTPLEGQMACLARDVAAFPGDAFMLGFPEAIGDAARPVWFGAPRVEWRQADAGAWVQAGELEGELSYEMTFTRGEDFVDIRLRLTNQSARQWAHSLAFNCFSPGGSAAIRDHDCVRHFVGVQGTLRRLVELPRQYGPRPTVQLYSVEDAPPGREIPFVANFRATPDDVTVEGWIAIVSRDGRRLVAAVSRPALFLFQNMEYSCIHSAASVGPLAPGHAGEALTRVYFVEASLEDWYARMRSELYS